MKPAVSVTELMTKDVISVTPETPLLSAVDLILKNTFGGLPVVNDEGKVVGILTDYDLTIKGSSLHLPTFLKLLQEFPIYKKDTGLVRDDIKKILELKVVDVMNLKPLLLHENTPIEEAVKTFSEHPHINPIPIVDEKNVLVGILSRYDLVKLFGTPSIDYKDTRAIDKNVNRFLGDFEHRFVLVSKFRTRYWLIASLFFAIVGFIIAFALMLRIS